MIQLNVFNSLTTRRLAAAVITAATLAIVGCGGSGSSSRNDIDPVNTNPGIPVVPAGAEAEGTGSAAVDNGQFRIELSATQFSLVEGDTIANVDIRIIRENGHSAPISLALQGSDQTALQDIRSEFTDTVIDISETTSNLQIQLGASRAPIQPQQRVLRLSATDGNSSALLSDITLNITPTPAPDVYLLIGQSNMVGASLFNAREAGPGQADEPDARILQLNVTGNDSTNFPTAAAFTNNANIANNDAPLVVALDPLHDGFNFSINSKSGTQVGMGISFARDMLPSTTANIMLVPAAWSDTGFCQTDTIHLPGMGWNATPPTDTTNFAGTLLHDRALARLNFSLSLTGGIFRGILWHQGEADSNDDACAQAYAQNLQNLVSSIRSFAQVDLRGPQARGAAADVPFIAGTLSIRGHRRQ